MGKVQLITYPGSMGGTLKTLHAMVDGPLKGLFPQGIHILPPYPSSGDRGFAPLSHTEIDPSFGSWQDIERIGKGHPVMLDLMINHLSRLSREFQDFLVRGQESAYADMFIIPAKVWPNTSISPEDLNKVFLRRTSPFSTYSLKNNSGSVTVWTTFGQEDPSEQIDIDVNSPVTRSYIAALFDSFKNHAVSLLRLDAVGYVVKKAGTSCFFVEPEIFNQLEWMEAEAKSKGIKILPEVHAPFKIHQSLAAHGYWTYDFVSPFLLLDSLVHHDPQYVAAYLRSRPAGMVTMLDCHDGIPVYPDVIGLVPEQNILETVDWCANQGALFSKLLHGPMSGSTIDVHQIDCTYYSALGNDDDAYLAARAIQLFLPGIPQVYYIGLFIGQNDLEAVQKQHDPRAINRSDLSLTDMYKALEKPVVQRQIELMRLRNTHPAFNGDCSVTSDAHTLSLVWQYGDQRCALTVDYENFGIRLEY